MEENENEIGKRKGISKAKRRGTASSYMTLSSSRIVSSWRASSKFSSCSYMQKEFIFVVKVEGKKGERGRERGSRT